MFQWGDAKLFMTTTSILEDMKDGFPPEQAPETFRDAIRVTRKLGFRYLWIDSLCIIQVESSRMGDVYGNSYLTIAASSAYSDSERFLRSRPFNYSSLDIISRSVKDIVKIYLGHREPHCASFDLEPLTSRAWTLQESKLSRRVLKFKSSKIV
jgi:hypothetical protein